MAELAKPEAVPWHRSWKWAVGSIGALVLLCYGCSVVSGSGDGPVHGRTVGAADVSPWPFTVTSGTLNCRGGERVTFTAGGVEYGLNGSAQAAGYPVPGPVWADDPALGDGLKISVAGLLEMGRALC